MAEFEEHERLLAAARRAYAAGYRRMDAYSPFPVEGLAEALGHESLADAAVRAGGRNRAAGSAAISWSGIRWRTCIRST